MKGILLLALRHVMRHRARSLLLIACLTVTVSLPGVTRILVGHFESRLADRARTTPLVVGAAGSRFDLALHALYFRGQPPRETSFGEVTRLQETGYGEVLPIFARFQAAGAPIVGTTFDYLIHRRLRITDGAFMSRHGDCVLGARVAERLSLGPGDGLLSEPDNVFDIDGQFPLRMRIAGVLKASNSPDDDAVFVSLQTAWIIAGIGHGHASKGRGEDAASSGHDASTVEYTEITDDNAASFHFHGKKADFPVTAIVVVPNDERSETLLLGQYLADDDSAQILQSVEVVNELMTFVVRIRSLFEIAFFVMTAVTLALLGLLTALAIRLRKHEFDTLRRIGGSRFLIARLIGAELLLLFSVSCVLTFVALTALSALLPRLPLHSLAGGV